MVATTRLMRTAVVAGSVLFAMTVPILRNQVIGQSEQETKKAILRAWKDRQDSTETALFEWDQTNRIRLSSLFPPVREHIRKENPNLGEFITVKQPSSIRLNKDKFDYRLDTIDSAKFRMPSGLRYSYNGKISQTYSGISSPDSVGSGIDQGDPHAFGTMMLYATPLLVHYRPLHPTMSHIDVNKYRVRTDKVPAANHLCILLEEVETNRFVQGTGSIQIMNLCFAVMKKWSRVKLCND